MLGNLLILNLFLLRFKLRFPERYNGPYVTSALTALASTIALNPPPLRTVIDNSLLSFIACLTSYIDRPTSTAAITI
jgi:hypothetical protein